MKALKKREYDESLNDSKLLQQYKKKNYGTASIKKIMAGEVSSYHPSVLSKSSTSKPNNNIYLQTSSSINDDREI